MQAKSLIIKFAQVLNCSPLRLAPLIISIHSFALKQLCCYYCNYKDKVCAQWPNTLADFVVTQSRSQINATSYEYAKYIYIALDLLFCTAHHGASCSIVQMPFL